MVQINKRTWITPTSYGLVFSYITKENNLQRVFIDQEASHELVFNHSDKVKNEIETKEISLQGITDLFERLSKEKSECDQIVERNKWKLFSLFPLQMSVQTVNYCNAHCDFCYANVPHTSQKKTFRLDEIMKLKDYCAVHGVKFGVSGGEPLLHPQIYDILSYKQDQVFDTLITNLTVPINKEKLVDSHVDLIQVSVHGFQKDHDNVLHLPGAYEKVMHQMRSLHSEINLATNTVITNDNIDDIPSLCDDLKEFQLAVNKQLSYVRFVPVVPSGTGKTNYKLRDSFIKRAESCLRNLVSEFPQLNFEIPLFHANPYEYFYEDNIWVCPAGSTVSVIRIDGHMIPCNQYLDTSVTSKKTIFDEEFQNIWISDPLFSDMRKGMETAHKIHCSECRYLLTNQDAFE